MRSDLRQCFRSAALLLCAGSALAAGADLLMVGAPGQVVLSFDGNTGTFQTSFGHTSESLDGIALGPDGNIYVASNILGYGEVLRFSRAGQFLGVFAGTNLRTPGALAFGAEADLYVLGSTWPETPENWGVLHYNGADGRFVSWFVSPQPGMPSGMTFGPDGNLYIADYRSGVLCYGGKDGQLLGTFVSAGSSGLTNTSGLVFGPDGKLYVSSLASDNVLRFDGGTGAFIDRFVSSGSGGLQRPRGLAFGPDGNLYVVSSGTRTVLRFSGATGEFLSTFASSGQTMWPSAILFTPELPRLSIEQKGLDVEISWTAGTNEWVLSACRENSAEWTWVESPPVFTGTTWVVREPISAVSARYRLQHR